MSVTGLLAARRHPLRWLAVATLSGSSLAGLAAASASTPAEAAGAVTVTANSCAPGWSLPGSGVVSLSVTNESPVAVDTELVRHRDGAIVASIKILGPQTTRPLDARLAAGSYELLCLYDHSVSRHSVAVAVTPGVPASSASPAVIPTTTAEMAGPVHQYDTYVAGQLTILGSQVAALANDVNQNNLAQAKADWLAAELTYSGIGGTYGALSGLEDEINGLPTGLPEGLSNPSFQGLRKIEYLLWSGQSVSAIENYTTDLTGAVEQAKVLWAEGPLTANLLSTRAHEILEDTQRDTLSGNDDEGSASSLARAWADLQGEDVVLGVLHPVLEQRAPKLLAAAQSQLTTFGQALQATKVAGQWVPLGALSMLQRERINAALSDVLETLSAIPDILEIQAFSDAIGGT